MGCNVSDCMFFISACVVGLWLEAAELIWASLVGFHVLPLPDKKVNKI